MHTKTGKTAFFFFILFFFSSLFGSETQLLTHYRENGIKDIAKELDKELANKDYWQSYLKDIDTSFGYFESYTDILTCDKSKSQLSFYKKDINSSYKLQEEYSAYTGKFKGDKKREGDLRTPVGIYTIVKKMTKVDPFYGPMAFVTSYPNLYDKYRGKTGQGIWIHGLPTNQKRDKFTKGCIAINNTNMICLNNMIDLKKTLLIIDEKKIEKNSVAKEEYAQILTDLFAWRYAWIYNKLEDYLAYYAPEFKRFDGMNKERFSKYKKRIFNKNESKTIIFKDINIIPYPKSDNIFKIAFKEYYKSGSYSFEGNKILIVKLNKTNFQIITEQ